MLISGDKYDSMPKGNLKRMLKKRVVGHCYPVPFFHILFIFLRIEFCVLLALDTYRSQSCTRMRSSI